MTEDTGTTGTDEPVPKLPRRHWWTNRSTGDVLILMVTFTVCAVVLVSGAVIGVLAFVQPSKDVTIWVNRNSGIINTMLGVVAGYLAGRTDRSMTYKHREQDRDEPVE